MSIFRFKQFEIDQRSCSMKINTDGVLLGALAELSGGSQILDIGTGTGVVAMMLAQRFISSSVAAVEIDIDAAERARSNFENSVFSSRLSVFAQSFQNFQAKSRFDLIVSNPPFFINSLKNPDIRKMISRHTDWIFSTKF